MVSLLIERFDVGSKPIEEEKKAFYLMESHNLLKNNVIIFCTFTGAISYGSCMGPINICPLYSCERKKIQFHMLFAWGSGPERLPKYALLISASALPIIKIVKDHC